MELVYLWIEDYKNIKKQGFNFSPQFECKFEDEYDENGKLKENCKLIINKNDDYVSILPDNINITAIVGENGSGKSSLLINIPNPQYIMDLMKRTDFILVYQINKEIKIISNIKPISEYTIDKIFNIAFDYCSYNQDFLSTELINSSSSYFSQDPTHNNHLLYEIYKDGNHHIDLSKYKQIINKMIFHYSDLDKIFSFNAKEIKIYKTFGNIKILFKKLQIFLEKESYLGEYQDSPINIYEYLLSDFDKLNDKEKFLIFVFLKHCESDKKAINLIHKLFENPDLEYIDLKEDLFSYQNNKLNIDMCKSFYNLIDDENLDNKRIDIKKLPDKLKIIFELEIQSILNIEFFDDKNRKFNDLSHGERHVFSLSLLIYDKLIKEDKKHKLILLDEPDNSLHPQWQKKIVNSLVTTFSKLEDLSIHIIMTSHSPFIISDLPKNNVMFLKDGKQIDALDKKQTFGANIHTLLSDGFFMDGGLMGEFAKSKIDEVIELLNKKGKLEEKELKLCKDVVSIIGEPILKKQLQRMLNNKLELSNKDEIDIIKEQMKELTNRLSEIENDSD